MGAKADVVMTTQVKKRMSPVLQRMSPVLQRMQLVNLVMAMIANVDSRVAKAAEVMTALVNQRMLPVNHAMVTNFNDEKVAREAANHEKTKTSLVNHVMIAKIAENAEIVVILMTLLMKQLLL